MYRHVSGLRWAAVILSLLWGASPLLAEGYWLRTDKIEYLTKSMPKAGTMQQTNNGWNCLIEADDSSITNTAKFGKTTIVTRVTWGASPLVIIPGEVIPVGGEVRVIKTDGPGNPEARVDLICQLLRKRTELDEKKKEVDKWTYIQDLFPKTNFVMVIGKTGASKSDQNTTVVFGEKGKSYKDMSNIYINYHASTAHADIYRVAYGYAWRDGPVPQATLEKMKKELEANRRKKENEDKPTGKGSEPKEKPAPTTGKMSLIDASGTWTVYSLGEVGTADEKKVHYKGSLVIAQNAKGGYSGTLNFGSSETLSDIALKDGVLHFSRALQGVTQKYTGRAAEGGRLEGTFTHNTRTFAWRAEKSVPGKGK